MALIELTLLLLDYYPRRLQFIYITLINTKWAQMLIKEIQVSYVKQPGFNAPWQNFLYKQTAEKFVSK